MLILVEVPNRRLDAKMIEELVIADMPRGTVPLDQKRQPILAATPSEVAQAIEYGQRIRRPGGLKADEEMITRGWGEDNLRLTVRYLQAVEGTSLHLLEIREKQGVGSRGLDRWFREDYPTQGINGFEVRPDGILFTSSNGLQIELKYFGEFNHALYFSEVIKRPGQTSVHNLYKYWPDGGRFDKTVRRLAEEASGSWTRGASHGTAQKAQPKGWDLTE